MDYALDLVVIGSDAGGSGGGISAGKRDGASPSLILCPSSDLASACLAPSCKPACFHSHFSATISKVDRATSSFSTRSRIFFMLD
jgi:hypothetical protein